MRKSMILATSMLALGAFAGCGPREKSAATSGQATHEAAGTANEAATSIRIDGSSTVYPITEAVAEEFRTTNPNVRVTVGISGTGGGFKKFAAGEIDIADASRPIKAEESAAVAAASIQSIELAVAFDGLTLVVHPENKFVDHLTVEELNKIWAPESQIKNWSEVRAGFPNLELHLYGAGHDSGTFDYFTEVINGKAQACRSDYTASEDDNVLVQGVSGDPGALGFFGFAYYIENQTKVRAVPIAKDGAPVMPTVETINNGTYKPLSRPIFIYVTTAAAERPEVQTFVNFFLDQAPTLVAQVGYVPLPAPVYAAMKARFAQKVTGSVYADHEASKGKTLEQLFMSAS